MVLTDSRQDAPPADRVPKGQRRHMVAGAAGTCRKTGSARRGSARQGSARQGKTAAVAPGTWNAHPQRLAASAAQAPSAKATPAPIISQTPPIAINPAPSIGATAAAASPGMAIIPASAP